MSFNEHGIALLNPEQHWVCLKCEHTEVTHELRPHTRMHKCRGFAGLDVPMVPEGTKGHMFAREREDYVGKDIVTRDGEGRVVMSIVTIRDEGQDCTVYAPCAVISAEELK